MDAVTTLLQRAATGVSGLDRILGGGLARNRVHEDTIRHGIVIGPPRN
jgi:hypothetical protein